MRLRMLLRVAVLLSALGLGCSAVHSAEASAILESAGLKGGLVVHLGCGDGQLTAALRRNDSYLVQGWDTDPANVEKACALIHAKGIYGPVSVSHWVNASRLPYTDNLVNLLVAQEPGGLSMDEILRVLCPGGVALLGGKKIVKPWPVESDAWTHYLHDPSNNAVSHDRQIDIPKRLQWIGSPRYGRHHDHMSSTSAMVSSSGRVFAIIDHGSTFSIQLPCQWRLVARDAFNGALLWQRNIDTWHSQLLREKSGPASLPRRLVAAHDEVYVTLGMDVPVSALDAATGATRRTYDSTKGAEEILCADGELVVLVNPQGPKGEATGNAYEIQPQLRRIVALKAESGQVLWQKEWRFVSPVTLTLDKDNALFFDGEKIICLDRRNGAERWQSESVGNGKPLYSYFAPTLVLADGIALFSGGDSVLGKFHVQDFGPKMWALELATGRTLWTAPHPPSGYRSPEDILVINGTVWTGDLNNGPELRGDNVGTIYGYDLKSGALQAKFKPDVDTFWFHHRCHRARATERFLLTSRTGIEFVDLATRHWTCQHWVRGACLVGFMPAYGMLYNPPHPCACYLEAKLYGFNAVASHSVAREAIVVAQDKAERLEKGPAYEDELPAGTPSQEDWPMLRANPARSGCVTTAVPAALEVAWRTPVGGRLSGPVVAQGQLFVAAIDAHAIHALDAVTGQPLWRFTAGARIDSPPTIWKGRVLFGSADGYVYCLRAGNGQLLWRYRAAPADLRMGAFEQIESVWPVSGSVLVFETPQGRPELWCVAGRSAFIDGGMRLLRLDPASGKKLDEKILNDLVPGAQENLQTLLKNWNMPVALPDVLLGDGKFVYMRSQQFDLQGNRLALEVPTFNPKEQKGETAHLFCPTGMLDDIWWHRSYWVYGRVFTSGPGGYYQAGRFTPAGRPMVYDANTVYSFGRKPQYYRWTSAMEYVLYAAAKEPALLETESGKPKVQPKGPQMGALPTTSIATTWTSDVPVLARAMVLAQNTLFVAGPPRLLDETATLKTFQTPATQKLLARQAAALEGAEGAVLWAVRAADGSKLAELKLETLPVFDGLIAANGRLYYSGTDGRVICLRAR